MKRVKEIIKDKGNEIFSIQPDATVYDAIHLLAEKEVGALLVMDGSKLVGIISERDYARQIILYLVHVVSASHIAITII